MAGAATASGGGLRHPPACEGQGSGLAVLHAAIRRLPAEAHTRKWLEGGWAPGAGGRGGGAEGALAVAAVEGAVHLVRRTLPAQVGAVHRGGVTPEWDTKSGGKVRSKHRKGDEEAVHGWASKERGDRKSVV